MLNDPSKASSLFTRRTRRSYFIEQTRQRFDIAKTVRAVLGYRMRDEGKRSITVGFLSWMAAEGQPLLAVERNTLRRDFTKYLDRMVKDGLMERATVWDDHMKREAQGYTVPDDITDEDIDQYRQATPEEAEKAKDRNLMTGPRGGTYYVNEKGNKVYV